jgi:uncharacterized membrane protein YjjP (DUF1212 family)
LILGLVRILYVNGQATEQTVSAAERLARTLGLRASLIPRWGALQLLVDDQQGMLTVQVAADPSGVEMARVASVMQAIGDIEAGRLASDAAMKGIEGIASLRPAPTWLFALAAASGAVALAVIFGVQHLQAAALIFVSAGAGACLRRALDHFSTNLFIQPFCAALLAGIVGALAVRYELSSSLRLVAVCPCMVLVPGPHFLNGALDLIQGRISLGGARLLYSALIVVAISVGLLLGLALLGVSLPVDPAGRAVPLWQDHRRGSCGYCIQRVFFDPAAHAGMAGCHRHVRSCLALGRHRTAWFWRPDGRSRCLRCGRSDSHPGFAANAYAVCGHWLCFRGVVDTRRIPVPDGERPAADGRRR